MMLSTLTPRARIRIGVVASSSPSNSGPSPRRRTTKKTTKTANPETASAPTSTATTFSPEAASTPSATATPKATTSRRKTTTTTTSTPPSSSPPSSTTTTAETSPHVEEMTTLLTSGVSPERLLEIKEKALADLFAPGQRTPSTVVAKLRREVNVLQSVITQRQLASRAQATRGAGQGDADGVTVTRMRAQAAEEDARDEGKGMRRSTPNSRTEEVLDDREVLKELLRLEAENEKLRVRAESLLRRQSALEQLMKRFGITMTTK